MDFTDIRMIDENGVEGPLVGGAISTDGSWWSENAHAALWFGLVGVAVAITICSIGSASVAWTQRQQLRRSLSKGQFIYDIMHANIMPLYHREKRRAHDAEEGV